MARQVSSPSNAFSYSSREHLGSDVGSDCFKNFGGGGPDFSQEDILAGAVLADGVVLKIDIDGAGNCIGDDERREAK